MKKIKLLILIGVLGAVMVCIFVLTLETDYTGLTKKEIINVVSNNRNLFVKANEESYNMDLSIENNSLIKNFSCIYSYEGFKDDVLAYVQDKEKFLKEYAIDSEYQGLILYCSYEGDTQVYSKYDNNILEEICDMGARKIYYKEDGSFKSMYIVFATSLYNQTLLRKYGVVYCASDNPKDLFTKGNWKIKITSDGLKANLENDVSATGVEYILEKICDNLYYYRCTS